MPKAGDKVRLTDRYVTALKAPAKGSMDVLDAVQRGLALRVWASGVKSWSLRAARNGKRVRVNLGTWPAIGIAEARQKAAEALAAIENGRDPNAEKREARRRAQAERERARRGIPATLLELINAREKHRAVTARGKGWQEERRVLLSGLAPLLDKPLSELTADAIMKRVRRLQDAGAPVAANRLAQYTKATLRWAQNEYGLACGVDPAAIRKPASEKPRERVLRDDELRAIWSVLDLFGTRGQLYRMALLSGQRRGEVAAMAWRQIEESAGLWHVSVSKTGRAHVLPLSLAMRRLLDSMGDGRAPEGLVFASAGGRGLDNWARTHKTIGRAASIELHRRRQMPGAPEIDPAKVAPMENWTIHDLRRTAATLLGRVGTRPEIIERILGHAHPTGGALASVYQRYNALPEMREALDSLARLLGRIVGVDLTGESGTVVPFAARN
jgi:integrase